MEKLEDYVSFGYLYRIGALDVDRLNAKTINTGNGMYAYKYPDELQQMCEECWENKVYYTADREIINKDEVKSWFVKYGLTYPKSLDNV
jgi:hypothetical protein